MSLAAPHVAIDQAIESLTVAVDAGAVVSGSSHPGSSAAACDLIDGVELARRLAAVVAVHAMERIHASRSFYEHGHVSARAMFSHVADVSGGEAFRLDQIRRMVADASEINQVWRAGELSVDKAAVISRAFANPRTRDRFLHDQR